MQANVSGGAGGGTDKITLLGVFIWAIAAFFFLYEFFLRTLLGSLEPQVMKSLQLNAETFSILGSCYYLTYGLMQIPVGIIVDKAGVKFTMVFASILCGISAVCFGLSDSFITGLLSRLLMGFGSSFAFICLLVLARTWFPKKNFGLFAGLSQFIGTLGPILAGGPLVLFLQKEGLDWRQGMLSLGGVGLVIAVVSLLFVRTREQEDKERTLQFLERRVSMGQQLRNLFTNNQAWLVAVYSALIYTSIATLGAIWGTRVLIAKGFDQSRAAEMVSLLWVGYAVGCPVTGYVSDAIKSRKKVLIFLGFMATLSTLSLALVEVGSFWLFAFLFFCIGFAGGAQNVGFATIVEKVSERLSATSMGLNNGLMLLFDTVNPILFGFLVTITLSNRNTDNFTAHNFYYALLYIPFLCLIATVISIFFIKETYCKPQKDVIIVSRKDSSY